MNDRFEYALTACDTALERAVLVLVASSRDAAESAFGFLKDEDFWAAPHRKLFVELRTCCWDKTASFSEAAKLMKDMGIRQTKETDVRELMDKCRVLRRLHLHRAVMATAAELYSLAPQYEDWISLAEQKLEALRGLNGHCEK